MAQRAGNRGVLPCQWETGGAVVERSSSPGGNGMARGALRSRGWEPSSHVIWYVSSDGGGALKRSRVTPVAVRGIQRVIVIGMAGSARGRKVRTRQRKSGNAVVERRTIPTRRGVTVGAIPHRERCAGSGMHRVVGCLPGRQMALRISAAGRADL